MDVRNLDDATACASRRAAPRLPARVLAGRLHRFARAEDGSILIFGLMLFLMFVLLVGVGLDVMRFETERTRAQYTLDRAVLASADISQKTASQTVLDDYFAKAGLTQFTPVAETTKGTYNEWKKVTGTLDVATDTWFMRWIGYNELEAPALATAEERIGNVEISMVLDVSGSMSENAYNTNGTYAGTKIALLKTAASDFVDTMFTNVQNTSSEPGKLSISIVPYNQQVVMGSSLAGYYNLSNEHTASWCADFVTSDYTTTAITPTQALPRTANADARNGSGTKSPSFLECYTDSWRPILAFSSDKSALKSKIGNFAANGDTAIDIGAKWGLSLLDPAARPVLTSMIANGAADSALSGRPFAYDYADTMKIMVLMTDGQNTNTYAVKSPYRSGLSPLYKSSNGKYYYYYDRSGTTYDYYNYTSSSSNGWSRASDIGTLTQQTWQQVWQVYTLNYFGTYFYKNATGSSNFASLAINHYDAGDKDDQLETVCDAAKANNVLIFAIAYQANSAGQAALKTCVSKDAYYYNATGTTIKDAFAGIANAINMLRLTQ